MKDSFFSSSYGDNRRKRFKDSILFNESPRADYFVVRSRKKPTVKKMYLKIIGIVNYRTIDIFLEVYELMNEVDDAVIERFGLVSGEIERKNLVVIYGEEE